MFTTLPCLAFEADLDAILGVDFATAETDLFTGDFDREILDLTGDLAFLGVLEADFFAFKGDFESFRWTLTYLSAFAFFSTDFSFALISLFFSVRGSMDLEGLPLPFLTCSTAAEALTTFFAGEANFFSGDLGLPLPLFSISGSEAVTLEAIFEGVLV